MKTKDRIAMLLRVASLEQIKEGIETLQNEFGDKPIYQMLFENDSKELLDAVEKRIQKEKEMTAERKQNAIQSLNTIINDLGMVENLIKVDYCEMAKLCYDNIVINFGDLGHEIGEIQIHNKK